MRKYLSTIIVSTLVLAIVVCSVIFGGQSFTDTQKETLIILAIICGSSILYCFVVGEISRNNSQMDKLWSILPIAYTWVIAIKGSMDPRLVIYAILVTIWGIRLTINFARKGAYSIKFWTGEEDYRWKVLRTKKPLNNKFVWAMFDLFFISTYQNILVLAICFPALACMSSSEPLGMFDYIPMFLTFGFILLETFADEQQMYFHTQKKLLLSEGMTLEELPAPYNKGFNTTGLWARSRHPNYFAEQAIWLCLYLFCLGAKVTNYVAFNWSFIGSLVLILLFLGSSSFGENISNSKYPEYKYYLASVSKYVPLWKYKDRVVEDEINQE